MIEKLKIIRMILMQVDRILAEKQQHVRQNESTE